MLTACSSCKSLPRAKNHSYCYPCKREYNRVNRLSNLEADRKKRREAYWKNRDKIIARRREQLLDPAHKAKVDRWSKESRARCSESQKARRRAGWRDKTPEQRAKHRLKAYGITPEIFEQLRQQQAGQCAICGASPKKLNVDHCHTTKKIRGLLCTKCNFGIGLFDDNPEVMRKAIAYLC